MKYKTFINKILTTRGRFILEKDTYFETHHIIPKCMGGNDNWENKIQLLPKEHFIAHQKLAKENPNNDKLTYAWWAMCHWTNPVTQERYEVTKEEYADAKEAYSKIISERMSGENSPFYGKDFNGENNPHFGKKHTKHAKDLISQKAKGRIMKEETKQKISKTLIELNKTPWNKGIKLTQEQREKVSKGMQNSEKHAIYKKPVVQYDKNGNVLKEWESMLFASKSTKISNAHISACCNHKRNLAGGFMWKFKSDKSPIIKYKDSRKIKIAKIDKKDGTLIEVFESCADAAKSVNGLSANITMCCSPKYQSHTYKGFVWKYLNDYQSEEENEEEE